MDQSDTHIDAAPGAASDVSDSAQAMQGARDTVTEDNFVPAWLAALVLILLLAVMALGGYVIRGVVGGQNRVKGVKEAEVQTWSEQVAEDPDNLDARVRLGYAYQKLGRYDKAVDEYEYVLERDSRNTAAHYNLGIVYRRLDLEDKAEQELWEVLKIAPDHVLAATALGELYAERREYRSLLTAVRPVVERRPEVASLQYLTGLAYEHTGHPDWAKARYRLALKYSPDYVEARQGLTRLGEKP